LLACAFALFVGGAGGTSGRQYHVSPRGDDGGDGSVDHPWKSLARAFDQLAAGDVLLLRGGTYYEHDLRVRARGTPEAPISIESYPGEHAVIDGGLQEFRDAPNQEWELVDERIQLYRSRRPVGGGLVRAWLPKYDIQLVEYSRDVDIESVNYDRVSGTQPFYMGPGVQLRTDGRVYIRLQPNPNDLVDSKGKTLSETPTDVDPGHNSLVIVTARNLILLDGAEHIAFKGLTFAHAANILDTKARSHQIEVSQCRFRFGTYGIVIRNGSYNWDIHECEFDNGLPEYVYWTDVKNGAHEVAEAYPEFQSVAVDGWMSGVQVRNCLFRRSFDAIHLKGGTTGAAIRGNVFEVIRDDAMEVETGVDDVEIAYNLMWRVTSGISHTGSDGPPGPVYIHHNVIDNSELQHGGRPGNYREHDWPVWSTGDPFGSHDATGKKAAWKVYNNTIVTRKSGYRWNAAGPTSVAGNPEKYVYNNIFYAVDDRVVYREDLASAGSHYDGNVMYRKETGRMPLLIRFGDGGDYQSLAGFRERSATTWEIHGLQEDPGFDVAAIGQPAVEGAAMWNRYRAAQPSISTPGASYGGLNWPGTAGIHYRGAVPPGGIASSEPWAGVPAAPDGSASLSP